MVRASASKPTGRAAARKIQLHEDGRSLAVFGLPLTEADVEISPHERKPYLTQ